MKYTNIRKTVVLSTTRIGRKLWLEHCQDYICHATKGWRKADRRYSREVIKVYMMDKPEGFRYPHF